MNDCILFAEWLAENHYRLYNIDNSGFRLWKNKENQKTTKQLYKEFKRRNYEA